MSFKALASIAASAPATTTSGKTFSTERISGFVCSVSAYTAIDKLGLTVSLNTPELGVKSLVPNFPLYPLVERADMQGGVDLGGMQVIQTDSNAATETEDIQQVDFYVDLGHIILTGEDSLDAFFTVRTAFSAGETLTAWTLDRGNRPEKILQVVTQSTTNFKVSDVEELYVYRSATPGAADQDAYALTADQLVCTLTRGNNERTFDCRAAYSATRALGNVGAQGTRRTAFLYLDKEVSDPDGSVTVNLTGAQAGNYSLFAVCRVAERNRAQVSAEIFASNVMQSRNALLGRDPGKLAALQMAGRVS